MEHGFFQVGSMFILRECSTTEPYCALGCAVYVNHLQTWSLCLYGTYVTGSHVALELFESCMTLAIDSLPIAVLLTIHLVQSYGVHCA